jgi:nucleotide-binding universal stress UspA family protein
VSAVAEQPILICYDGSPEARHAIEAAGELLAHGAAVVVDVTAPATLEEREAAYLEIGRDPVAVRAEDTRRTAHRGAALARLAGFHAVDRIDVALPTWQGIVDLADSLDASVIVVGSRGLSRTRELFEGSTSHQLAMHAGRPVLIVPPAHG